MSIAQAANALDGCSRWQELIADNLASASVPGFKRRDVAFSLVESGAFPEAGLNRTFSMPRAQAISSFSHGEMRLTGVPTDVAIEGSGFFAVQLPNGATAYTRDGEFKINNQGQLVTKQGYIVLGDGGEIFLDRNATGALSIASTGEISQGDGARARLRIVDFNQPQLLTPISGGCFLAENPALAESDVVKPSLRQAFLEMSNASPSTEMVNLITVMRSFEANQRVIQLHDERMGRVISELGNPT
jgi:flagellar basal-body rod protein FlgF